MGIASRLHEQHHWSSPRLERRDEPPARIRVWLRPDGTIELGNRKDREVKRGEAGAGAEVSR
jgi:hypothetical protein